jgi:hypothetical protein
VQELCPHVLHLPVFVCLPRCASQRCEKTDGGSHAHTVPSIVAPPSFFSHRCIAFRNTVKQKLTETHKIMALFLHTGAHVCKNCALRQFFLHRCVSPRRKPMTEAQNMRALFVHTFCRTARLKACTHPLETCPTAPQAHEPTGALPPKN